MARLRCAARLALLSSRGGGGRLARRLRAAPRCAAPRPPPRRALALDAQAPDLEAARRAARERWGGGAAEKANTANFTAAPAAEGRRLCSKETAPSAAPADPGAPYATFHEDTIAAIVTATSPTQGGVAVVRLSGSGAAEVARRCFRTPQALRGGGDGVSGGGVEAQEARMGGWVPESHRAEYGYVVDGAGAVVDEVLLLPMLAPRSFTAEDVIELQGHGGAVCPERVLSACVAAGARLARPGEFSLRAYRNGRLDLTQAEAVQRLIASRTSRAADAALAAARGGLGDEVRALRDALIDVLVEVEARIDFEEELPPLDVPAVSEATSSCARRAREAAATAARGRALEQGIAVALVGRPNTGKSSLLNAWTESERSIVTAMPGTTRDVVEAPLVLADSGVPVRLLDTAGIRDAVSDEVEAIGVARSRDAAGEADAVVMVISAEEGWTDADAGVWESVADGANDVTAVLVVNKTDLRDAAEAAAGVPEAVRARFAAVVGTSALQRQGMPELEAALLAGAAAAATGGGAAWAANARQGEALLRAAGALESLEQSIATDLPLDCWTVDLREAIMTLGEVSGEEVKEEVLDRVFSTFCIGK